MSRTDPSPTRNVTRRGLLRGTAAAAATGLAAGAAAPVSAQGSSGPDYGDWFSNTDNFDGTHDETGKDSVTVTVGAKANGGTFGFGPAAVRVSPGTKVTFDWASDTHTVTVQSQPDGADWQGHDDIEDTGFSYSHTFETPGIYEYYCIPHEAMGMKGAIVVGDAQAGSQASGSQASGSSSFGLGDALTIGGGLGLVGVLLALFVKGTRENTPERTGHVDR